MTEPNNNLQNRATTPFMVGAAIVMVFGALACSEVSTKSSEPRLNVLMIVADDLNCDSVGIYGASVPDATPNIDRLAGEGLRFERAHVNVSVCQPSRQVLLTGRYSHNSGGEGFHELRLPNVPLLPGVLRDAGYRVGVLGKLKHSTPYKAFQWDTAVTRFELGMGRNPALYGASAKQFMEQSIAAQQPFFLMANSHDPHRPFYAAEGETDWYTRSDHPAATPSKTYEREPSAVPGFLPRLKAIATEVASYYGSVRRCDDTVGAVLDALDQVGARDNTIVVFLSDNGMAFPFAKASCYLQSTRTPLIVRWPGVVKANESCQQELVSGVDFMPTMLECLGLDITPNLDGESFLPLLQGKHQQGREAVFTQYGQTATNGYFPIRCVQTAQFGYIFNAWSDGVRTFDRPEDRASGSYLALERAAKGDAAIADRFRTLRYRELEEFYDFDADPDGLHNLSQSPEHAAKLEEMRTRLEQWMVRHKDPLLEVYRSRDDASEREALLERRRSELGS